MNQNFKNTNRSPILFSIFLPAIFSVFLIIGFVVNLFEIPKGYNIDLFSESGEFKNTRFISSKDLNSTIIDTVYTDKDTWIEIVIPEQMAYLHYRDGTVLKYPISTGVGNYGVSVTTRPGLFAIFYRNAHHLSSQFDNADMYHFMAFNQGIGFHSINGTGYYAHLGVRPSSKGCVRLKHDHARDLFNATEMGTLVLAHSNNYKRRVAFAPEGFKNPEDFSKEDYRIMLARNLQNILEGNYFVSNREYFVIDSKTIPISGAYIGYDKNLPEKHSAPRVNYTYTVLRDKLISSINVDIQQDESYEVEDEILEDPELLHVNNQENKTENSNKYVYSSIEDELLVKKYFNNPIGVLPYFPPNRR